MPERLHTLHYEYVEDIEARRGPHRAAHLEAIERYHEAGRLVIAGAVGEPVHGGLFGFRSAEDAEAFAAEDPYGRAGLVQRHTVEPWNVVTPLP